MSNILTNISNVRRVTGVELRATYDVIEWQEPTSPLIRVRDGIPTFAKGTLDKRKMVDAHEDGDVLLFAWAGRYSTDVFLVDDLDRARRGLA